MTKLQKVLNFVNRNHGRTFTWKQFNTRMKCQYPCAETNYLSMLVHAGFIKKPKRGQYLVEFQTQPYMSYLDLKGDQP